MMAKSRNYTEVKIYSGFNVRMTEPDKARGIHTDMDDDRHTSSDIVVDRWSILGESALSISIADCSNYRG